MVRGVRKDRRLITLFCGNRNKKLKSIFASYYFGTATQHYLVSHSNF